MALRLDWLYYRRDLYMYDWSNWIYVPYQLSGRHSSFFRDMGELMAGLQSSSYGLHLVRSAGLDWGRMRDTHVKIDLDQI